MGEREGQRAGTLPSPSKTLIWEGPNRSLMIEEILLPEEVPRGFGKLGGEGSSRVERANQIKLPLGRSNGKHRLCAFSREVYREGIGVEGQKGVVAHQIGQVGETVDPKLFHRRLVGRVAYAVGAVKIPA